MQVNDLIAKARELGGTAWSFVSGGWKWFVFAAAIGVLCFISGCMHGEKLEQSDQADAVVAAQVITDRSAGAAAGEREQDRAAVDQAQKERADAIENSGDDRRPDAASLALNCDRVRRAGKISEFPACRGYAGGGETASDR